MKGQVSPVVAAVIIVVVIAAVGFWLYKGTGGRSMFGGTDRAKVQQMLQQHGGVPAPGSNTATSTGSGPQIGHNPNAGAPGR